MSWNVSYAIAGVEVSQKEVRSVVAYQSYHYRGNHLNNRNRSDKSLEENIILTLAQCITTTRRSYTCKEISSDLTIYLDSKVIKKIESREYYYEFLGSTDTIEKLQMIGRELTREKRDYYFTRLKPIEEYVVDWSGASSEEDLKKYASESRPPKKEVKVKKKSRKSDNFRLSDEDERAIKRREDNDTYKDYKENFIGKPAFM